MTTVDKLGDFTTTRRVIPISGLALLIGLVSAFVALALLKLIGLFTNLFFFGRWGTALVSPAGNTLIRVEVSGSKAAHSAAHSRSGAYATLKLDVWGSKVGQRSHPFRELRLRGWRAGDHYRPAGQARDCKLKEMFQRARVPSWRRPFWPILCMGQTIVWSSVFGMAAEFAANPAAGSAVFTVGSREKS